MVRVELFCLQLEASCLQLSFFAYSYVLEFSFIQLELFNVELELFQLQLELVYLQWEYVSELFKRTMKARKLNCKHTSSNCEQKSFPHWSYDANMLGTMVCSFDCCSGMEKWSSKHVWRWTETCILTQGFSYFLEKTSRGQRTKWTLQS